DFEAALDAASCASSSTARVDFFVGAVERYRGPLLPGYYEDWVLPEQQRLAQEFFQATRQLTHLLEERGDLDRARRYAARAVAIDPLREEAHRELIRLYADTGQPAEALRQFRELERLLDEEFGAAPSAATCQLADEIERESRVAAPKGGQAAAGARG